MRGQVCEVGKDRIVGVWVLLGKGWQKVGGGIWSRDLEVGEQRRVKCWRSRTRQDTDQPGSTEQATVLRSRSISLEEQRSQQDGQYWKADMTDKVTRLTCLVGVLFLCFARCRNVQIWFWSGKKEGGDLGWRKTQAAWSN